MVGVSQTDQGSVKDQKWMSGVTRRGGKLLLTFLNVLRQPLQTLEQAFPCGGATKQVGGGAQLDTWSGVLCDSYLGWTYHERSRIL